MIRRLLIAAVLAAAAAAPAWAQTAAPTTPAPAAPRVLLSTSEGDITLELDAMRAPRTVENFLAYVRAGHYEGTIFHRVIGNFMIQGGGFTQDMKQKATRPPIKLESQNGLKNDTGWLAMARTSVPDSATSQFFINVVDNARLDYPSFDGHGYTAFGKVVAGMDVVDRIRDAPTTANGPHQNLPVQPIVIRKTQVLAAASPTATTTEKK